MLLNEPIAIRISSNGAPLRLPLHTRVVRFSYEDVEKGDDLCQIEFADPYNNLADIGQLTEGTVLTVQWGFPSRMHPPRKVIVRRPKYTFGAVEVECLDRGSALRMEERWDVVQDTTVGAVINTIAQRNGLQAKIDAALTQPLTNFAWGGRSDYEILQYLRTRLEDHFFKVIGDVLHFKARALDAPPVGSYAYAPGRDSRLLNFSIGLKDQDHGKRGKQTTAVTVNPRTLRKQVFKADESTTPVTSLGNRRPQDSFKTQFAQFIPALPVVQQLGGIARTVTQGTSTGKSLILPPSSDDELATTARAARRGALLSSIEAEFEILAAPGDPFYNVGDLIEIQGIGQRNSGRYQLTKVSHEIGMDGYVYKMTARRNASNSVTSGLLPTLNGRRNTRAVKTALVDTTRALIRGTVSGAVYGTQGVRRG